MRPGGNPALCFYWTHNFHIAVLLNLKYMPWILLSQLFCVCAYDSNLQLSGHNPTGTLCFLFPGKVFTSAAQNSTHPVCCWHKRPSQIHPNCSILQLFALACRWRKHSQIVLNGLHRAERNVGRACWPESSFYYIRLSQVEEHMVCGCNDCL